MALGGPHATAATGWQDHTIRGATSGALKKKLGITVEATREVSVLLAEFATVWDELFRPSRRGSASSWSSGRLEKPLADESWT
jgi:hypothetical protein